MPPTAKITKEMILNTVLLITRERGFETVNARSIAERLQCSTRPIFTCYENVEALKREFLEFAQGETHLFKLLFINNMDLKMTEAEDFAETIGVGLERAKKIFLDLFFYTHGMAVPTATKKLSIDRNSAKTMLTSLLSALIRQEKPDWNFKTRRMRI